MRIKQEYKNRVVTISGTYMNTSKELGKMNQTELKQLQRLGYNFEGLIEEVKPRKKKYKGIDETPTEDGGE